MNHARKYARTAIVVNTAAERERIQRDLDPTGHRFRVISAGQAINGYRFDGVIVTDSFRFHCHYATAASAAKSRAWFEDDVIGRMLPDARLVHL